MTRPERKLAAILAADVGESIYDYTPQPLCKFSRMGLRSDCFRSVVNQSQLGTVKAPTAVFQLDSELGL